VRLEELIALLLVSNLSLAIANLSFRLASASIAEKSYDWLQTTGGIYVPARAWEHSIAFDCQIQFPQAVQVSYERIRG
jgi:hypothetical protein